MTFILNVSSWDHCYAHHNFIYSHIPSVGSPLENLKIQSCLFGYFMDTKELFYSHSDCLLSGILYVLDTQSNLAGWNCLGHKGQLSVLSVDVLRQGSKNDLY